MTSRCLRFLSVAVLASLLPLTNAAMAQSSDSTAHKSEDPFSTLRYRYIGPPGNRVTSVVGVPGDMNVYYAGAASGGVWKSFDAGIHWYPIFDKEDAQSIGSIAIAPSNHSVVWVGTGEPFIRSNVSLGNGIYKSIDGGRTWQHMGLEKTGRIGRIVIDPHNPDIVYAAALGTCYGPQQERGVYRTTDGGKTWKRVLFVDENTGVYDLTIDPADSSKLIAASWQIDIKTWGRNSGGPGSGLFVTADGGDNWKRITGHGLPASPLGKIAVSFAPSDARRVYALIETGQGGTLWRSDSGGSDWTLVNYSRLLNERPHYYTRMLVMPDNENEVYFPSNGISVTFDGGETSDHMHCPGDNPAAEATATRRQGNCGGDNHDMWADPTNPSRMMIGSDGGVLISTERGRSWNLTRLPIAQMYHVATDNRIPYMVYGQMQDGSPLHGPSNVPGEGRISASEWTTGAGCETGWQIPDPVDDNVVWGGCYAGVTERFDAKSGFSRSVSVWPDRTMGANAGEVKIRMNWTYPIAISPHDHNTVYVGSQYVHKTTDGGQTWTQISPDLTLNDPSMHGDSGGLTVDNLSVEYAGVVYAIAESPVEKGQIWAGTNDGQVQMTRDGGTHWTNLTANIPGLPPKMTVDSIEPSKYAAGTCYVAFDGHQVDIRDPYLYKTTDYGKTWTKITDGIPSSQLSYTHVVREDPVRKGLLYSGTENGLYISFDDGAHWQAFQQNLPHAPVYWMTVQSEFKDLVVGTYGRGFWIMDDITALENYKPSQDEADATLYPIRHAYRFRAGFKRDMAPAGASVGQNPPDGVSINFFVKSEKVKASLDILDGEGKLVQQIHPSTHPGINRVWWNLRYEPTHNVALRTTPPGNPHIWSEKRFAGKLTRPVFYYGVGGESTDGPLVPPGKYTAKLTVNGKSESQPITVIKDPRTPATVDDAIASSKLSYRIYEDTNLSVDLINQIEWSRKQLEDTRALLVARHADKSLLDATDELNKKFLAQEDQLLHPTIAEEDEKSFRGPLGLYLKFVWLGAEVGTGGGDVAGNSDDAPTEPEKQVFALLDGQLHSVQSTLNGIDTQAVSTYNSTMQKAGIGLITTVVPAKENKADGSDDTEDSDDTGGASDY
ncbi:WD40/YVTN/BNR-like repeat-containing protein [Acidicapsa dinghuensis]|uniref:WD40/YVTN/BNR-like repeat-containing protein n=1 Tax=Acidicapsa dinghuensis TaxID=2218256 RepID=A0ABW1ELB5_9BACT|nr:hypothetical protein [Acidicapsa dinghuensis]